MLFTGKIKFFTFLGLFLYSDFCSGSDIEDRRGHRSPSVKGTNLIKVEDIFPKDFYKKPYISTEQLLDLVKDLVPSSRPIKEKDGHMIHFRKISKTFLEEKFIVILDIRNAFKCSRQDFKLYTSSAADQPLLSDQKLKALLIENFIKNPLRETVGKFYVTILKRTHGKFSEDKAVRLRKFMDGKDELLCELPSTLRNGKQSAAESLRQLLVQSSPKQAEEADVEALKEQEIKSHSLKAEQDKKKVKKSEKLVKTSSPPLDISLKNRMKRLASSGLPNMTQLPLQGDTLKKTKLSSQDKRTDSEVRKRSYSFSGKGSGISISPSNSRSVTPLSDRREQRAGSIDMGSRPLSPSIQKRIATLASSSTSLQETEESSSESSSS